MARPLIGLDVGTHAVRAVELVANRGEITLRRFAQVTLPPGAVLHGEVVDTAVVATAIKRLWSEGGFSGREVIVGVANQRVVVRQAEVSRMSAEEFESAIQFQVQELIPIPVEEARLDFQILDDTIGTDDNPMMRILLVAAQRDMVESLVAALSAASVRPSLIDVGPFALLRALGDPTAAMLGEPGDAEALVSVGAGVTTVVVHEQGVPQFVRILVSGGLDVTEAIAAALDVDIDTAEDLKRRSDPTSTDEQVAAAGRVVADQIRPFVDEVRGSLDFYLAQSPLSTIRRIQVTGGGSRIDDFATRLAQVMDVPVVAARPLLGLRVGRTGLTDQQLSESEDLMATAIGLALAGLPVEEGRRRISLLPREVARARLERRQAALVGGGVAALAALLVLLWAARGAQVSRENDKADAAEADGRAIQTQITALQGVEELDQQVSDRRDLVRGALVDDIAWTRILQEVATVIPSDVWLTTFNGSASSKDISFAGKGMDHTSSARWLLRVEQIQSLRGLWLPSSVKAIAEDGRESVTFASTAQLTDAAQSDRLQRFEDAG